jgi:pimeloyl-ACP methyl ester carboxylesterase
MLGRGAGASRVIRVAYGGGTAIVAPGGSSMARPLAESRRHPRPGGIGILTSLLLAGLTLVPAVRAERLGAYDYPFVDPVLATVVATPLAYRPADFPDLEGSRRLERRWVRPFPERRTPDVFWYQHRGVEVALARQKGRAPLVVVVAGTGGSARSLTTLNIADALYHGGHHVLTVPSPTALDFIVKGSQTGVPGRARDDARDLYRVIRLALADIEDEVDWSAVHLAGFSLGGLNAAYLAELDARERAVGFGKVLLMNPPVSLYNSANILDGMFEKFLGDQPGAFRAFLDAVVSRFSRLYIASDAPVDLSGEFLYRLFRVIEPTNEDLETLVGVVFRLSGANLAFAADVLTHSGYVVPADAKLGATSSLTDYATVASTLSFRDYIEGLFLPYFQRIDPGYTLERAIEEESLRGIEGFLRRARNIALVTNEDDIILAPGELVWLEQLFGDRATVYPTGGHGGNFTQYEYVERLNAYFRP